MGMFLDMRVFEEKPKMRTGKRIVRFESLAVLREGKSVAANFVSQDNAERHTEYFELGSPAQVARLKAFLFTLAKVAGAAGIPAFFADEDALVHFGVALANPPDNRFRFFVIDLQEEEWKNDHGETKTRVVIHGRFDKAMYPCAVEMAVPGREPKRDS